MTAPRRHVTPDQFAAALHSGVPLRLVSGLTYELPANFAPQHPVDVEGDGTQTWMAPASGSIFVPDRPLSFAFRNIQFDWSRASGSAYVVALANINHPIGLLLAHDCALRGPTTSGAGGLFGQANSVIPDLLHVGKLDVRRVHMRKMSRALALHCSIGVAELEDVHIDGYKRFGITLGPLSEVHQRRCISTRMRNIHVWNGSQEGVNSNAIYVAGRDVLLEDFSCIGLGDGVRDDTEGLYFKAAGGLTVQRGLLHNCGGMQGMAAFKGGGAGKPKGGPVTMRQVVLSVDPGRPGSGVWHQTDSGDAVYEDIATVNLQGAALRVINSQPTTNFTLRRWTDRSLSRLQGFRENGDPIFSRVFKVQRGDGVEPCNYTFETCIVDLDPVLPADQVIENNGGGTVVLAGDNSWEGA